MHSSQACLVFNRAPHSARTLETIANDVLRRHGSLLPKEPAAVPIDRLVEQIFGFNETYEKLERGVLGEIHFGIEDRPIAIRLARRLGSLTSNSSRLEQERRATLAHECGHGIAHSKLFADWLRHERAPLLPGFTKAHARLACNQRDIALGSIRPAANSAAELWLEWEANYLMAALLLPRNLVLQLLSPWIAGSNDGVSPRYLPAARQHTAITTMAHTFDVDSFLAAQRLGVLISTIQPTDFFDGVALRCGRRSHPRKKLSTLQHRKTWSK